MHRVFGGVYWQARLDKARLQAVQADNVAFRAHYRLSFAVLLACAALVSHRQYVGAHILCVAARSLPAYVVETFCFSASTFTVLLSSDHAPAAATVHPGVGPVPDGWDSQRTYHAYYQWVPFVLFGQAMLFRVPHALWRWYEADTITRMVHGLQRLYLKPDGDEDVVIDGHGKIPCEKTRRARMRGLINRLDAVTRSGLNQWWACALIGCELLNLANVLAQLWLMDRLLDGRFFAYGASVFLSGDAAVAADRAFPKVTACEFRKYGPSGTLETYDAMCVMALNVVNEKVYAALWLWYVAALVPLSCAALLWRAVQYAYRSDERFNRLLLWCGVSSPAGGGGGGGNRDFGSDMAAVARETTFSDWLFLCHVTGNVDPDVVGDSLRGFAEGLRARHRSRAPPPHVETSLL